MPQIENNVASIILEQLGGAGRLKAMIGAANFVDHGDGLSFKFKGSRKANYVKVTLRADDTYLLELKTIAPPPAFIPSREIDFEGVYWDMLQDLIERETGLYLSL